MSDIEYSVYCDWHSFLSEALPLSFDGIIYLKTSPEVSQLMNNRNVVIIFFALKMSYM